MSERPRTPPLRVVSPLQGVVVKCPTAGTSARRGEALVVVESMKMEHVVEAPQDGVVASIAIKQGDVVSEGQLLCILKPASTATNVTRTARALSLDEIRPDLDEALRRHAYGFDAQRPDAVAKRRRAGLRTTRENVADLVDEGTLREYGPLVIAAQRQRRSEQELIEQTPGDGMVTGTAHINGDLFGAVGTKCIVMSYDYTVLAGTQGTMNHLKKDRMFELAKREQLPVVLFAEGGGGRPGDTDHAIVAGLDCRAFQYFAELSGQVPLIGINAGRCFAGNAALLGCCDVVIATSNANIGMGGPAMVEGGGLGTFKPEDIGPAKAQYQNGVIDVMASDEAQAVAAAKKYLAFFQGTLSEFGCADQRLLRHVVPENRLRAYDIRAAIDVLVDRDSLLELRGGFGVGMITALARIEGAPFGLIANNPHHLGGAIDGEAADKASDFMNLCNTFGLPVVFLCDTPGFMVGPEIEETGLVKRAARMFKTGASLRVPCCTVVLRKAYGLGAQSMAAGGFKAPAFTVAWPTGEFGAMGLEGAVRLGYRKELAAAPDDEARERLFQKMVDQLYERGKAVNMAAHFEIDDVIDPVDTRTWIRSVVS